MKYLFFAFCIVFQFSFSQNTFSAKYFSTKGNYSDSLKSKSNSDSYLLAYENNSFRLLTNFDNLQIKNPDWNYGQKTYLLNSFLKSYPYYFNISIGTVEGKFDYIPFTYSYNDNSNLYSLGVLYNYELWYFGGQLTHFNARGILNTELLEKQKVNSFTLEIKKYLTYNSFFSLMPHFTSLSDGRKLTSLGIDLFYFPFTNLTFKAGGFVGKRAYYFNPDLLTLFNQNDTQENQINYEIKYTPINFLTLAVSYQKTKFEKYSINYFTIGSTFNLQL